MRKLRVQTHEDEYDINADYMKTIRDDEGRPTHLILSKKNQTNGVDVVALFNFASVVGVLDVTDEPGNPFDFEFTLARPRLSPIARFDETGHQVCQ